jgi:hypothetical protein
MWRAADTQASPYRTAAPRLDDDDRTLLEEAKRDVQRANDERRLRFIARMLSTRETTASPPSQTTATTDDDGFPSGGAAVVWLVGAGATWLLAGFVVTLLVVVVACVLTLSVAAVARRWIELRHYGRAHHRIGGSVALLGCLLAAAGSGFLGGDATIFGWVFSGIGGIASVAVASRRREWDTDFPPQDAA